MLSDAQIAILCDIGQASSFDEEKRGDVLSLVVRGYVERDGDLFKITTKRSESAGRSGGRAQRIVGHKSGCSCALAKWLKTEMVRPKQLSCHPTVGR
jgi:hypothetical protein